MNKDIERLKKYVKRHGTVLLAAELGCRNSSTINQWIVRGSIPEDVRTQVITFIKRKVQ